MQTANEIKSILESKIPRGLVLPEHTSGKHFYRYGPLDELYGSVTAKCGILETPHLKAWSARLAVEHIDKNWNAITPANKEMIFDAAIMAHVDTFKDAGAIGTQGHGVIDFYLKPWIQGDKPPDIRTLVEAQQDVRVMALARSAEMFCNDFEAYPIASEMYVAHPLYKYAGTLDSLMMVRKVTQPSQWPCTLRNDKGLPEHFFGVEVGNPNVAVCPGCAMVKEWQLCIVDWKSSNSIDKVEYAMQTCAYWYALNFLTRKDQHKASTGLQPKEILIVKLDKRYAKYEVMRVVSRPETFKMFLHCSKIYDWMNNEKDKLTPLIVKTLIKI